MQFGQPADSVGFLALTIPLFLRIGWRYLGSSRQSLRFVTRLSAIGLVISVATLLLVQGVLAGFESEMRERVLGVLPHVSIHVNEFKQSLEQVQSRIESAEGVIGTSLAVVGNGLLVSTERMGWVALTGIDPESIDAVSDISKHVVGTELSALEDARFGVLVGSRLAERLRVGAGDELTLVLPSASVSIAGVFPRQRQLGVLGIVETKSLLDDELAFMHIRDAQRLFRDRPGSKAWNFRLEDPLQSHQMRWKLRFLIGAEIASISDWTDWLGPIYEAIITQKVAFLFIFSIFVAVAAFSLVSGLVLVVHDNIGENAVLRTLGARTASMAGVFLTVGMTVAVLGTVGGGVVAVIVGHVLRWAAPAIDQASGVNLLNQYVVSGLPVDFRVADVLAVAGIAIALCFMATLVSAVRASAAKPAEVLRHE